MRTIGRKRIEAEVQTLTGPIAEENGLELVDVEYRKEHDTWVLRIFIDKEGGITLDDCQALSEQVSRRLDEVDPIPGSYSLEVSSPGLERPLKRDADFVRFAGHLVKVRTYAAFEGRKTWQGKLVGIENDCIAIEVDGKSVNIPRTQVAKANLAIEF